MGKLTHKKITARVVVYPAANGGDIVAKKSVGWGEDCMQGTGMMEVRLENVYEDQMARLNGLQE